MSHQNLNRFPDDLLLQIFKYLSLEDLFSISVSSERFADLCVDRDLVRVLSVEDQTQLKEEEIKFFLTKGASHVRILNFNHCYWLSSPFLQWAIQRCSNLQELHLLECRLSNSALVSLLASLSNSLSALSFSVKSFTDIKKDAFSAAHAALKEVRRLRIYYSSKELSVMSYLGEHTTLLDYCSNLEELIVGSAGMAIPELYRPVVTKPKAHLNLKVMAITSNMHVGAQMLFYGTLSQLPNAQLHLKTLLMPNVNFNEFTRNDDFKHCFGNIDVLEHLDVSGSKVYFPNKTMDLSRARNLKHVCLRMTLVRSEQLMYIASHCSQLTSVNLYGCNTIFYGEHGLDMSGLEALFSHCRSLETFNMAGEHHHIHSLLSELHNTEESQQAHRMLNKMRGLKRLAIPVCMLREPGTSVRPSKRSCTTPTVPAAKRTRTMISSPSWKQAPSVKTKDQTVNPEHSASSERSSSPIQSTSQGHRESNLQGQTSMTSDQENNGDAVSKTVMGKLVANNPDMAELEIIAVNFQSAFRRNKYIVPKHQHLNPCVETRFVRDTSIQPICRLKNLISLTLIGIPSLVSADCLQNIAQSCKKLQNLSIGHLGGAVYGNSLPRALSQMSHLNQLRIEQPNLYLNRPLFDGLSHCSNLHKICIIAKNSSFHPQDVLGMVAKLLKLYVIQLFSGATLTSCKSLASTLTKRHSKQRPALSVTIHPLMHDALSSVVNSIPANHMNDLTRFHSRVADVPPEWTNKI